MSGQDLKPWEAPPDESYWQALLMEGEYPGDNVSVFSEFVAQQENLPPPVIETASVLPENKPDNGQESPWDVASRHLKSGEHVELSVTGFNRGGLLVEWNGLVGFVPASQVAGRLPHGDEQLRNDALAAKVGQMLVLQVIEMDPSKNRLIFSERACEQAGPLETPLLDLHPGDVCRGRVTNLCSFGVFVDLGGVEGLVHISELSWERVAHPEDMLERGQEVDVYVLNVSPNGERIALSLKRLQPGPWAALGDRYQVGQVLEGIVTSMVSFGAFVRLEEGIEGLIHISKLRDNGMSEPVVLEVGQKVRVRIVNVDTKQHRIGLDLEI